VYNVLAFVPVSANAQPVGTPVVDDPDDTRELKFWVYVAPRVVRVTLPAARAGPTITTDHAAARTADIRNGSPCAAWLRR
jgi:hypothetical protein